MTKEEFRKKLDAIPDEIFEKCYVVNLLDNQLQLNFNPEITKKYYQEDMKINKTNGYLEFVLKFQTFDFEITMT